MKGWNKTQVRRKMDEAVQLAQLLLAQKMSFQIQLRNCQKQLFRGEGQERSRITHRYSSLNSDRGANNANSEGRAVVCAPGWEQLFTDKFLVVQPRLKNACIHHFQHLGMRLLCMSSPMDFMGTACWLEMQLVCAQGSASSHCSRAVPGSKSMHRAKGKPLEANWERPPTSSCPWSAMYFLGYETFCYKNDSFYGSVSLDFFLMIPRNLDFFLTFPLLPSPLLMQSLLYSCHFSRYFLFLTSYGLAKLNRICSFLLPACQLGWPSWDFVHPALSSNSLLELGSLCWGTDWSHRAWACSSPCPASNPARTASVVGRTHRGSHQAISEQFLCWGCWWRSLLSPGCRGGS